MSLERSKSRWFAHPIISLLVAVSWLALSRSLEPVHLLSALLLGLIVPRLIRQFLPEGTPVYWPAVPHLVGIVLWDIVMSNITVAKLVLGPTSAMSPAWIPVNLETDHQRLNALFASIITTTPGTVSATIDEKAKVIWVHALNCDDISGAAIDMKNRYEVPLMKIFKLDQGATS